MAYETKDLSYRKSTLSVAKHYKFFPPKLPKAKISIFVPTHPVVVYFCMGIQMLTGQEAQWIGRILSDTASV
jgi:hypothetical protein